MTYALLILLYNSLLKYARCAINDSNSSGLVHECVQCLLCVCVHASGSVCLYSLSVLCELSVLSKCVHARFCVKFSQLNMCVRVLVHPATDNPVCLEMY